MISRLRYACLILDHDDTAVNSTPFVHYPSHVHAMRELRPWHTPIDLDGWYLKNFDPGVMEYLAGELRLTETELEREFEIWRDFTISRTPAFYPGFLGALDQYRASGGVVTVVSHSEAETIERHYRLHTRGNGLPDMIHGWDDDAGKRKPSPRPVHAILEAFDIDPDRALIVDDLKPGVLMSRSSGVPVAAAGWAHRIPEIQRFMRSNCVTYLEDVAAFGRYILQ